MARVDGLVGMWEGIPAPVMPPAYQLIAQVLRHAPHFPTAACRDLPPQVMDGGSREDVRTALGACMACPVQLQCRAWATRQDVRGRKAFGVAGAVDGVIGGMLFGKARKWADAE